MKNKKFIIVMSALATTSLLMTGCGKKIELKDGKQVAVSIKGNKITAEEYFDKIKTENIPALIDMLDKDLLEKEYKTDEEENKKVKDQLTQMESYYKQDENMYKKFEEQRKNLEEMMHLEYKRNKAVTEYLKDEITEHEVKKYYDEFVHGEIKASHILIKADITEELTKDEKDEALKAAEDKAKDIIKQLKDGKKFSSLAKKYSEDKSNNEKGGDLGYFNPDEMVPEFKDAVLKLKKGEYTKEPVKTKFGYHIIIKKDEKDKKSLKDSTKEIKEKLVNEKLSKDNSLYYKTLIKYREKKNIKWNDKDLEKKYEELMNDLIEQAQPKEN